MLDKIIGIAFAAFLLGLFAIVNAWENDALTNLQGALVALADLAALGITALIGGKQE